MNDLLMDIFHLRWVVGTYFFMVTTVILLWVDRVRKNRSDAYKESYQKAARYTSYLEYYVTDKYKDHYVDGQEIPQDHGHLRHEGRVEGGGDAFFRRRKVSRGNSAINGRVKVHRGSYQAGGPEGDEAGTLQMPNART